MTITLGRNTLYPICAIGAALLFLGDVPFDHRIVKSAWNLGHFFLFFIGLWLTPFYEEIKKRNAWLVFIVISILVFGFALAVEYVQIKLGRDFSYNDVILSVLGAISACLLIKKIRFKLFFIFVFIIYTCKSLFISTADSFFIQAKKPVIADFTTPFEYTRFGGDSEIVNYANKRMLKVSLLPDKRYTGFSVDELFSDWSLYTTLNINVYTKSDGEFTFTCRVNDRQHDINGYNYDDRFNRKYSIDNNNMKIVIDLDAVKKAPAGRDMNMQQISNITCFIVKVPEEAFIYIDKIYLQ